MPRLRVNNFSVSLDGYAAGPDQDLDNPLGVGDRGLHDWAFATRTFRRQFGLDGGDDGLDEQFASRGNAGIGATIMGRNMFGPIRGSWPDENWRGWWGDEPPFHHQVFVLSHHPRASLTMQGGTTFHFVDPDDAGGIDGVLKTAFEAADGRDVKVGGGVSTVQQFLRAGLIDDMHVVFVPILLGGGERLFDNLGGPIEYECVEFVASPAVAHARFERRR